MRTQKYGYLLYLSEQLYNPLHTSTVSTASRAASVRISTHVKWNPWILFSWDLYNPHFVLVERPLGLSYKLFS